MANKSSCFYLNFATYELRCWSVPRTVASLHARRDIAAGEAAAFISIGQVPADFASDTQMSHDSRCSVHKNQCRSGDGISIRWRFAEVCDASRRGDSQTDRSYGTAGFLWSVCVPRFPSQAAFQCLAVQTLQCSRRPTSRPAGIGGGGGVGDDVMQERGTSGRRWV